MYSMSDEKCYRGKQSRVTQQGMLEWREGVTLYRTVSGVLKVLLWIPQKKVKLTLNVKK